MPTKPGVRSSGVLKYEAKYCAQIVEFMGRGYSLTAFAGEIGASRATLLKWCEIHVPFAEAVACAQARRARALEDRLLAANGAGAFGAHMQALKTAAPDEWPTSKPTASVRSPAASTAQPHGGPAQEASFEAPDNGRD